MDDNRKRPMPLEQRRKISESVKANLPLTIFKKGYIPWHKGKHIQTNTGRTHFKKGHSINMGTKRTVEQRKAMSERMKGKRSRAWKGGVVIDSKGYVGVYKPSHPFCDAHGYIRISRLVMEQELGRFLKPGEVVHHINKDKSDNRIENLILFINNAAHLNYHKQERSKANG